MNNSFSTHLHPPPLRARHARSRSPRSALNGIRSGSPEAVDDAAATNETLSIAGDRRKAEAAKQQRATMFHDLYTRSESRLARLFDSDNAKLLMVQARSKYEETVADPANPAMDKQEDSRKRTARVIDEEDYGDDEEEADIQGDGIKTLVQNQDQPCPQLHSAQSGTDVSGANSASHRQDKPSVLGGPGSSVEDARKQLEGEKKAAEQRARQTFETTFYTLENDRDAMLEQQKLDELDRQVETEISGQQEGAGDTVSKAPQQGTLSSTNLGASSLTLKHLIARIDAKRLAVEASDAQLRSLMSEVRKNRSKWASEEKIGQEELYEASERVLMELKAMTEYAAPFLQKVNKREAPDYYHIIKTPMDIGTMIKKLKQLQYKSKKEFCDDLGLIWSNCMRYNAEPNHGLRKKAEHMKRETARLTQLIPDISIRDRADVEAEERRQQLGEQDGDDADDSDEEPIIASRGRKAPSIKGKKGAGPARKAPPADDSTATLEHKTESVGSGLPGPLSHLKNEVLRSGTEAVGEASQHCLTTPPPPSGMLTPIGGHARSEGPVGAHAQLEGIIIPQNGDTMELDTMNISAHGAGLIADEPEHEDEDYKVWKQITKKDRAHLAAERYRLLGSDKINPEATALLRTRGGMRRWLRRHNLSGVDKRATEADKKSEKHEDAEAAIATTLADDIDVEEERMVPDYYDVLSAIPQLEPRLRWIEDDEDHVIEQREECLRMVADSDFKIPVSALTTTINDNMRQVQEIRKLVAKIGVVKQMQIQAQTYQNQFQKYEPEPFMEADIGPIVVSDDGPIIASELCRSVLQRSVGRILYHAGFEDFQPSALEAITDVAADYFQKLVKTLGVYHEAPKAREESVSTVADSGTNSERIKQTDTVSPVASKGQQAEPCVSTSWIARFSPEEQILLALNENGVDIGDLETYIKEDVERLSGKLETHHARTKEYLLELLRPALDPSQVGTDGVGAFNDGSEQFIGGDFAEDIDEDFFGFKELGLDKEFTIDSLSVPFHLLQSRMHTAYQPINASATSGAGLLMEPPPPYEPVTLSSLRDEIGLVHAFFAAKLAAAGAEDDTPLIEDEELPAKQRFPKPRLPPTGKISSPRKRPIREQQMMARKKRKLELEAEREQQREQEGEKGSVKGADDAGVVAVADKPPLANGIEPLTNGVHADAAKIKVGIVKPSEKDKKEPTPIKAAGKLKLDVPPATENGDENAKGDPEKQANGLMSPESLAIAAH